MSRDTSYNGWSNSFTWLVNLHEIVDEETAAGMVADVSRMDRSRAAGELSANIKMYVEDLLDDMGDTPSNMFVADMFSHAMGMVDWYELAEAMINDHVDELAGGDDE